MGLRYKARVGLYSLPPSIRGKIPHMETKKTIPPDGKGKRTVVGSIFAGLFGALGAVYLINPTAGLFELIPDNLPVIGNLDEAAAVLLLISCLAYFESTSEACSGASPGKSRSSTSRRRIADSDSARPMGHHCPVPATTGGATVPAALSFAAAMIRGM